MSVTAASSGRVAVSRERAAPMSASFVAALLLGVIAAFILSWSRLVEIWQHGTFFDTDDAMRLVQVRSWLDGQGWFDLVVHRLHPPEGLLLHWSRVVDVPLAALILLFELFTSADRAETLARIVFPLGLQVALLAVTIHLGRLLAGPRAAMITAMLLVGSGFTFEQFPAGRIDHHAPQITLLVAMTATILGALEKSRAWQAGLAALCLATSLAISLENLPFMVVIVAALPLVWLADPVRVRVPLLWFAAGLGLAVPLLFVATVPLSRALDPAQDAFSIIHVTGAVLGSVGIAVVALCGPYLSRPWARALLLALVGGATLGCVLLLYPQALRDPYATMDPLLKRLWLSHVAEAEPLLKAARQPGTLTTLLCPVAAGTLALAVAVGMDSGTARIRWAVLLALSLVGIAGMCWEIRVTCSTQPLAIMGGVFAVTRALAWAGRGASPLRTTMAAMLALPFSTLAWACVPTAEPDPASTAILQASQACHAPAAVSALGGLPTGLVFASIDDGAFVLVHTPHAVVAAPYHRNQEGNKAVLEGFLASPALAEPLVRATGARYVAICPGETEMALLAREAPQGLGAQLAEGRVPSWLIPLPLAGTPYCVFAVERPNQSQDR